MGDCLDIGVPFPKRDEKTEYKRSGGTDKGMEKPESLLSDALMLLCKLGPTLAAPWTIASQAPLSMGFPRQEYWSGLPCPSPGDLPHLGIKTESPAFAGRLFITEPPGNSCVMHRFLLFLFLCFAELTDAWPLCS